ncbi:hypothetical protein [Rahnella sikkimica]|uniref:Uncharacterized protein n=1 Tax=Rahnella sikkimica TaxID=1805933 RepID=A0A2L1UZ42_9GAMM|nr:hypothetical protein [Rahnella sikkimica]AVF38195.1 hypothetical protein BV494_25280 [Rahnella sikkimica]
MEKFIYDAGHTVQGKLTREAFSDLVVQLLANSKPQDGDNPLMRALRLFLSKHGTYCGGYLLLHLSRITWLWTTPFINPLCAENVVIVEVDVIDDEFMEMTVKIGVPENYPPYPPLFFDERYTGRERVIYLFTPQATE